MTFFKLKKKSVIQNKYLNNVHEYKQKLNNIGQVWII